MGEYMKLADKYPELKRETKVGREEDDRDLRGLLVTIGPESTKEVKQRHAFIPRSALGDVRRESKGDRTITVNFRGENALMETIQLLSEHDKKKPVIYFTQGNGELVLSDQMGAMKNTIQIFMGAGNLRSMLAKDNYDVYGLVWGPPIKELVGNPMFKFGQPPRDPKAPPDLKGDKDLRKDEVPEDARLVVIVYPFTFTDRRHKWPKSGLDALERYMERGGKLLVINPTPFEDFPPQLSPDLGLTGLLAKYGVRVSKDYILNSNPNRKGVLGPPAWGVTATAPPGTANRFAQHFIGQQINLTLPHVVDVAPAAEYKAEVVLVVKEKQRGNDFVWAEKDSDPLIMNTHEYVRTLPPEKLDAMRAPELPVAVAVTDKHGKARVVVLGDSLNAANFYVNKSGPYYDFIRSAADWLVDRPVQKLGIPPKESNVFVLRPDAVKHPERMIWLPLGLTVALILGVGLGVWVVRRR
jgi:hypothetical protein